MSRFVFGTDSEEAYNKTTDNTVECRVTIK